MKEKIKIVSMDEAQLEMAMGWAKDEGWNPGRFDFKAYYALFGKENFRLLLIDEKPAGSIIVAKYEQNFAFIGLFIIIPQYRKKGYGRMLWQDAMRIIQDYISTGLYAVREQCDFYKKYGFSSAGGENDFNRKWQLSNSVKKNGHPFTCPDINSNQQDEDYEQMIKWDTSLWGYSRKAFFDKMLQQHECYIYVSIEQKSNQIVGYGMIRPCFDGFRIGPLYSKDFSEAQKLTEILLSQIPNGSKVIINIPTKNPFSQAFAEYFHLESLSAADTQKMTHGLAHNGHEEQCYGVASLEIG